MDPTRFDALARVLAMLNAGRPTRRSLASILGLGALAAGLAPLAEVVEGKKKKKKKKKGCREGQQRCTVKTKKKKKGKKAKKTCIDVLSNAANCGGCGVRCADGQVCQNGQCQGQGGTPPGPTFSVSGRSILDSTGKPVLLRGVNKMTIWDDDDPDGSISFPEIKKTGANTVRIVWAITDDNGQPSDDALLDRVIANAKNAGLVPMVELHDATGDFSKLPQLTAFWTRPAIVNIVNAHSQYLLVNIGNEVGDDQVGTNQFINGYTTSVQAIRNAGIRTPLVIDAPDFGKNLDVLTDSAAALLAADPLRNLIFSVHLYWPANGGATPQFIKENLQKAVNANYPLIVGEFSQFGAYAGENVSICSNGGLVEYQTILEETQKHGIGWYAWEWGPGNGVNDPLCAVMDMTPNRLFANLAPGWATEVATTSPFSIKNTSVSIL